MSQQNDPRSRRQFLTLLAISLLATQLSVAETTKPSLKPILKSSRLKVGDTVGLINPGSQIKPEDIKFIKNFLLENGFKVKLGAHIFDQYGYLAGKDQDRAADVNKMFADDSVQALLTIRGGWGCNRILPFVGLSINPPASENNYGL